MKKYNNDKQGPDHHPDQASLRMNKKKLTKTERNRNKQKEVKQKYHRPEKHILMCCLGC